MYLGLNLILVKYINAVGETMTRNGRKMAMSLFLVDQSIQLQKRFESFVTTTPQWSVIKIFDNDYTFQCLQIKIVFRYHHFVTQETKKVIYFLTKGHVKNQADI